MTQLHGLWFKPKLRLLFSYNFTCSDCVGVGFFTSSFYDSDNAKLALGMNKNVNVQTNGALQLSLVPFYLVPSVRNGFTWILSRIQLQRIIQGKSGTEWT